MSLANTIRTAIKGLAAYKLRSALTALGVMIGVASVIITLALGNGARAAVEASFRYLGSDQIQVATRKELSKGEFAAVGKLFTYEEGLELTDAAPLIDRVAMSLSKSAKVRRGRYTLDMVVTGTTAEALETLGQTQDAQPVNREEGRLITANDYLGQGRFYTPAEVQEDAQVCVMGYQVAEDLFGGEDPLGQTVWINREPFTVIGVIAELEMIDPGDRKYRDPNALLLLPIGPAIRFLFEEAPDVTAVARVSDPGQMQEASDQIRSYLRGKHAIMPDADGNYEDDFSLTTKQDLLGAQQEAARTFSILLTAMAIVSLVVGGIGILNVMLVSVTERTREIGVRKAIGARRRDIILQFLMESMLLSAASGLAGICLGILLIPFAGSLSQGSALLEPASIPLSFGAALVTGVVFGIYPALRAARLNPIEALGYE